MIKEIHKMPLKDMDPSLLTVAILDSIRPYTYQAREAGYAAFGGSKKAFDEGLVFDAIAASAYLHRNQRRKNRLEMPITFYIEHPLRNAMRALRIGVTDPDVIIAIILHDVVEDCAFEIVKLQVGSPRAELMSKEELRERALEWIKSKFGWNPARIVGKLSNPIEDQTGWSRERKNTSYVGNVRPKITDDPEVFIGKFVDLVDNASGLKHNDIPELRDMVYRLATKYIDLIDAFEEVLETDLHLIQPYVSEKGLKSMRKHLVETRVSLTQIIERHAA